MLLPAEIESKSLIPALRAILAKKLAGSHKIREDEISKMLGVTQAAVSNYIRGTRGDPKLIEKLLSEDQVVQMIDNISDNLASNMAYTPASLSKFIGLCNYIKSSLLICDIHPGPLCRWKTPDRRIAPRPWRTPGRPRASPNGVWSWPKKPLGPVVATGCILAVR